MIRAAGKGIRIRMAATDMESWARLRLVQGESTAQLWEFVGSTGQTVLTVGSDADCSWVVRGQGVAGIHFSLHWDGSTLRIADTHGAGGIRVDGKPVTSGWRIFTGRERIEFGRAAILVETSSALRSDAPHPLDPASAPASVPAARSPHNATLLGVSAEGLVPPGAPSSAPAPAPAASGVAPSQPTPTASESFRPKRPGETQRPHKPTLMGMSISAPPPAPGSPSRTPGAVAAPRSPSGTPGPSAPPSPSKAPSLPAPTPGAVPRPGSSVPAGTLLGVGMPSADAVRAAAAKATGQRVGGASLLDDDQRTIQGFPSGAPPVIHAPSGPASKHPGRSVTHPGVGGEVPGVTPGAVAQTQVRAVSSEPPPPSVASTWQEVPSRGAPVSPSGHPILDELAAEVPRAGHAAAAQPRLPSEAPRPRERHSDPRARHAATIASNRPKKPFPWHYVGIAILTVVAYIAWLYLLDHL